MRPASLVVAALALAGCLGTDHVFPDESDKVSAIHVNAYDKVGQDGVIEITGRDAGNVTRAFRGAIHLTLEEQHEPPDPPTYSFVAQRDVPLTADSFTNQGDFPIHVETIPRSTFPEAGTYRVTLSATVGDRRLPDAVALFYAEP